jgi:hypothetical protein
MNDTQSFKRQIKCKEGGKFYSSVSQETSVFLRIRWFLLKKNQFLNVSHDFYSTALHAWGVHFDDNHAECMLLKTVPQREKIEETVHLFSAKAYVIDIDEDSLFDEISSLKAFVMKENKGMKR